ncbi:FKBP-type peptidyl-prolyl cis-trans isomerase [Hymenobacter metallilatus]|uniref:peptidylprolyl isomerase n=1 Tax=Hymenobacter metallilatus TaxID=2493666 RepID=A0A3R9MIJ2_9BACT|nr:FKBP-type peptidyl-prolyl cis-trans isomerase [Hymenobacter metallilatus]RSK32368.1 FKBP-type peptidyl-prolyl cis-trans isomerase [Hymenobacter metallilatus]
MSLLARLRFSVPALLAFSGLTAFQGDPAPFNRLASGLEYRIYHRENGRYVLRPALPTTGDATYPARVGRIMSLHLQFRTATDSVLMHSRRQNRNQPVRVPLDTVRRQQWGSVEQALSLLQPGDSGVFRLNVDTVFLKSFRQPVPPFIRRAGPTLTVLAKAEKVQTQEEARQEVQQQMLQAQAEAKKQAAQLALKEDARIQAYLKLNKLKGIKTPSGLYYAITKVGPGPKPKTGQTVAVLYTGMLLSGKVFDASARNGNKPIEFPLGQGRVIPGWDQGIALLPKGSKAVLLIPSALAYGPQGAGADIPANSILRFNVELVGVK